jgi:hypothetical protein
MVMALTSLVTVALGTTFAANSQDASSGRLVEFSSAGGTISSMANETLSVATVSFDDGWAAACERLAAAVPS